MGSAAQLKAMTLPGPSSAAVSGAAGALHGHHRKELFSNRPRSLILSSRQNYRKKSGHELYRVHDECKSTGAGLTHDLMSAAGRW